MSIKNKNDDGSEFVLAVSDDQKLLLTVKTIMSSFENIGLNYVVTGSFAMQSYLNYFFRLPVDLDVVLKKDQFNKLIYFCQYNNFSYKEKYGKLKINTENLFIDVSSDTFDIIDEINDKIHYSIELVDYLNRKENREVFLLFSDIHIKIPVMSLEINIIMELIRPIFTDSIMTIYYVFTFTNIDYNKIKFILKNQILIKPLILSRLFMYDNKIKSLNYFPLEDIKKCRNSINDLIQTIN